LPVIRLPHLGRVLGARFGWGAGGTEAGISKLLRFAEVVEPGESVAVDEADFGLVACFLQSSLTRRGSAFEPVTAHRRKHVADLWAAAA
jgi:hypothetical protein